MGVFSTKSKAEKWKREFEEDCGWSCSLEISPWVIDGEL